jgi:hypothetical protein
MWSGRGSEGDVRQVGGFRLSGAATSVSVKPLPQPGTDAPSSTLGSHRPGPRSEVGGFQDGDVVELRFNV